MVLNKRRAVLAFFGVVLLAVPFAQGCARDAFSSLLGPWSKADYKVVLMDSGQIFFGRMDKNVGEYVVLKDVYYMPRIIDRKSGLMKLESIRGHSGDSTKYLPDTIYLDSRHIMLIEKLSPDSKVIGLIEQERKNSCG